MFKLTQPKALKKVLAGIKKKAGRTPYRIAKDNGIPRSHISGWITGSRSPTEEMKCRIVHAVRQEAREAGLEFPDATFKEYLSHGRKVA